MIIRCQTQHAHNTSGTCVRTHNVNATQSRRELIPNHVMSTSFARWRMRYPLPASADCRRRRRVIRSPIRLTQSARYVMYVVYADNNGAIVVLKNVCILSVLVILNTQVALKPIRFRAQLNAKCKFKSVSIQFNIETKADFDDPKSS